jgi:flagellin
MTMVIGTNLSSLSAQRHLASSKGDMENAMERLSSGNRINSSRDDAAGLAITSRMTSQVNGLNQAVRNANDGISLAQSAEGALDETTSILQRMRDLSVQASSDTLTSSDRTSIQSEMTALTSEIGRISSTTKFNNNNLLDGTAKNLKIQVGASEGETVSITIAGASAADLGIDGSSASNSGALAGGRMSTLAALNGNDVNINGVSWVANTSVVGANEVINDANGDSLTALTSTADGVASIINAGTAQHGAVATASNLVVGTVAGGDVAGSMTINSVTISASANLTELVANINAEATNASARVVDGTHIELYNDTGENIVVGGTITNSGLTIGTYIGFLSLSNTDGSKTLMTAGDNVTAGRADVNAMGFNERSDSSTIQGTAVSASTNIALTDDVTINGVSIGPNTADVPSAAEFAAHLNTYSASTNVTASARTEVTMEMLTATSAGATTITAGTSTLIINGNSVALTQNATVTATIATINTTLSTVGSGIVASQGEGASEILLTSEGGATISITDTGTHLSQATNSDGVVTATGSLAATLVDFAGTLTLTNTAGGDIVFGTVNGTESELDTTLSLLGIHAQGSGSTSTLGTVGLSMSTSTEAAAAVTLIDAALEKVFASRGDLGAFQNRLDHTVSNLRNVSENTAFSKSQIMDTDFATESANLAKAQVLQQAGTAMLAQANASGQSVLSLLK